MILLCRKLMFHVKLCTSDETTESLWIAKNKMLDYIKASYLVEKFNAYIKFQGDVKYLECIMKTKFNLKLKRLI